jgi:hypothetical protein
MYLVILDRAYDSIELLLVVVGANNYQGKDLWNLLILLEKGSQVLHTNVSKR